MVTSKESTTDPDYQWAMDVLVPPESETAADERAPATSSTFVDGSCELKNRVAGRGAQETVQLLVVPQQPQQTTVRLVAAWATSHEAVRLTPVLELVVVLLEEEDGAEGAIVSNNSEDEGNPETGPEGGVAGAGRMANEEETKGNPETGPEEELVKELKEELREFVQERELLKRQQKRPNDNSNDDPQARHDAARRDPIQGIQEQIERAQKQARGDSAEERLAALDARHAEQAQDRRQKLTDTENRVQDRVMRDRKSESVYERHNKNKINEDRRPKTAKKHHPLLRYEIGFDVVHERLSVGSYFQGALWMIGGSVALTYACLWASRRGGGKGRRDL